MSHPQVHHLYECLHKDMPYNPAQIDQFTQMQEPDLPEFLYHMDEDEDPVPCLAMTNPYEAILTHDSSRSCVRITPDMLQSMKPQEDAPDVPNGIDILYPPDSGKAHLSQVSLWSIMSDRPSYTIHSPALWTSQKLLYGFQQLIGSIGNPLFQRKNCS